MSRVEEEIIEEFKKWEERWSVITQDDEDDWYNFRDIIILTAEKHTRTEY